MLIHSISVNSWPVSLLKDIERWVRNFIWSGDTKKRKLVIVAWHKCCKPLKEGGLGLKWLTKLNEASNLKLCWDLMTSQETWAMLLKSRVFNKNGPIKSHICSSLCSSVKVVVNRVL